MRSRFFTDSSETSARWNSRVPQTSQTPAVFGGFVEMHAGERADGADAAAEQLLAPSAWPLGVVVCVTCSRAKAVGSTAGMEATRASSPYWRAWIEGAEMDLAAMRRHIAARDLEGLGELAEHSCLKMHALALSARPPLVYWNGTTLALMNAVRELRRAGTAAYYTIDAGPQVKVLCAPGDRPRLARELAAVSGVERVIESAPGEGVELLDQDAQDQDAQDAAVSGSPV